MAWLVIRAILRNFSAFAAAALVDRVVTFFFLLYAARMLGPDAFGQFLLVGTYVLFFTMVFTAGITPVALREIVRAGDQSGHVVDQVLSLRLVLGISAYVLLLLITAAVLPVDIFLPMAAIAGTALILDAFKDSFAVYHSAQGRMAIPSAFQATNTLLTSASGALLLHLGHGVLPLLTASALVNLVLTVGWHFLFSTRIRKYRVSIALAAWKDMLLLAAPIAPMMIIFNFNRLASVVMLSAVSGPIPRDRSIGYFGPAQQLANVPLGFIVGLRYAMMPPIAAKMNRGERIDEEFALSLRVAIVFLAFPMAVATSLFPGELLQLAFGEQYLQSAAILRFLGLAAALTIASFFPETFVISQPEKQFSRFLPGAIATLLANLVLCAALIPYYGAQGAACAFLVSRAMHLLFFLHYSRQVLSLDSLGMGRLVPPIIVLVLTYAACAGAVQAIDSLLPRIAAVTGLCAMGCLAAGGRDLARLWSAFSRRGRRPH
jgi:O-antigen/teichoic acid export membrane protein